MILSVQMSGQCLRLLHQLASQQGTPYFPITVTSTSTQAQTNGQASSLAITVNVSTDDSMGVLLVTLDQSHTVSSVTDNQGSNWVEALSVIDGGIAVYIFYTNDLTTTGNRTVTVTPDLSSNMAIGAITIDNSESAPSGTESTNISSGNNVSVSISPSGDDSIIIFGMTTGGAQFISNFGAGQVEEMNIRIAGSPSSKRHNGAMTSEIITSSSSNTQTAYQSTGGQPWVALALEIKHN